MVDIKVTREFKTQTTKAILSIAFFAFSYLLIVILAIGLTALCIYAGFMLIAIKPMFITITLGIGLASLGVLILIFLVKFIFKSHKVSRSHLHEIQRTDEPELFAMIDEIVTEVGTSFPKKVYLSTDVNAAVFYDSGFWSMFLPIKKNLQIGLGLVNTVSRLELKAILAHEFGHFSQRTMKVGSYVYNLNQIIFNMLHDNDSYNDLIQRWSNISSYFSVFVSLAIKIISGIQWILRKLYVVVNISYLGLSREMEFHADEIAANVAGHEPLKNSLLRMTLADHSLNSVLNFYNAKIPDRIKTDNLYRDHLFVMNFLAERNNFSTKDSLPEISLEDQSKFDKSKLVIKDQWASHPGTRERIERLEKINIKSEQKEDYPANGIFSDIEKIQKVLTGNMFGVVVYDGETNLISPEDFQSEYRNNLLKESFSRIYNGYYDHKNPIPFELNKLHPAEENTGVEELFSDGKVELVYTAIALQGDMETLKNISNGSVMVKTFDYDGKKYSGNDSAELLQKLDEELNQINEKIKQNDIQVFLYFKKLVSGQNKPAELERIYQEFFDFDMAFDTRYEIYTTLSNELQFINVTTPFEQIEQNLSGINSWEEKLKTEIESMLTDPKYLTEITTEIRENLERYTSKRWSYFNGSQYQDENLNTLFTAMNNYAFLLSRGYFLLKKNLLAYQEDLLNNYPQQQFLSKAV